MRLRSHLAIWSSLVALYVVSLLLGLKVIPLPKLRSRATPIAWSSWQAPDPEEIPEGHAGDEIRYGLNVFENTPWFAPRYTGNRLTCGDCHVENGTAPYASPLVGMTKIYPTFNRRAGRVISLRRRIQQCFVRSENGLPPAGNSPEMEGLIAYIQWLSRPEPDHKPFSGRGLIELPRLQPNPARGAQIYAMHCAGCHGEDGAGSRPMMPPLWGPESFNDGAGMNNISKMARFVQYNMPQNRRGTLSAQEAYDVSAFIHAQPRPRFNPAYTKY